MTCSLETGALRPVLFASLLACGCGTGAPSQVASTGPATTTVSPPSIPTIDAGAGPRVEPVKVPASPFSGDPIQAITWSPGGRYLGAYCVSSCAARGGSELFLIDRGQGALRRAVAMTAPPGGDGASAVFSPDDAFLATTHGTESARVSRTDDGAVLRDVHLAAVYDNLAWSPDSARLVIGSALGSTTLLGFPKADVVRSDTLANPFATGASMSFAWSPASDRFVITRAGTEIRDAKTGAKIGEIPGGRSAMDVLAIFRDPNEVIFAACDGLVQRVRPSPLKIETLRAASGSAECALTASPDGGTIYRAIDAGIDVFDAASKSSRRIESPAITAGPAILSPDGQWLAEVRTRAAGQTPAGAVQVFDARGSAAPVVLEGETVVGWAQSGELYRMAGSDLVAWSPTTKKDVFRATFEASPLAHAMSPDRRFIAVADGQIVLVRASDHRILRAAIRSDRGAARLSPEASEIGAFLR